jgi:beta-glucosidase
VHDCQSVLQRPPKELKGFAKVELEPGQTKTIAIPLDFRSFAYYHPAYKQWVTEDGQFDILIGASARDIPFSETVTLQSTLVLPSILNQESTVREWVSDPVGKQVSAPVLQTVMDEMARLFGGGEKPEEAVSKELMDMPLRSILHFNEALLPMPADDLIDSLLAQVCGS